MKLYLVSFLIVMLTLISRSIAVDSVSAEGLNNIRSISESDPAISASNLIGTAARPVTLTSTQPADAVTFPYILVGNGESQPVNVYTATGDLQTSFAPFSGYREDIMVASGDLDGDGRPDVVMAQKSRNVRYRGFAIVDRTQLFDVDMADRVAGGISIAVGDVNGDGRDDIITGTQSTANGHVKVFSGIDNTELRSFFAFPGFLGGVNVAAGDVTGDGFGDIILAQSSGDPTAATAGHVKVFDGKTGAETRSFFAFPGFNGGVFVAAGDVNGDGTADIIVAADNGVTGGHVKVFDGKTGAELRSFFAFPGFAGGVRVAAGDLNGDGYDDVVAVTGPGTNGHVKAFDGKTGALILSFLPTVEPQRANAPTSQSGLFVAVGTTPIKNVEIAGRVLTPDGAGLKNAVVSLTDSTGVRRTAITTSFGNYSFTNVPAGKTYTIGVQSKRYRFGSRILNVSNPLTGIDLVGLE